MRDHAYPIKHLDVKRYALPMGQLSDEVHELVTAWRAQRPDLDVEPLPVLSRVTRLARHLDPAPPPAAGLVRREPAPRDRRGVLVTLSEQGRAVVDEAFTDLLEREQALLAGLADDQRQLLAGLLRALLAPFDSRARG